MEKFEMVDRKFVVNTATAAFLFAGQVLGSGCSKSSKETEEPIETPPPGETLFVEQEVEEVKEYPVEVDVYYDDLPEFFTTPVWDPTYGFPTRVPEDIPAEIVVEMEDEEDEPKVVTQEQIDFLMENEVYYADRERKVVAMTYDDGGSEENIRHIMDAYEKYGFNTTFFVTGQWVNNNRELTQEIINRGFEVGCHSWDHAEMTSLSDEQVRKQIEDFIILMYEIDPKYDIKLMRFPYGSRNERIRRIAAEYGLQSIMWSHGSGGMDETTYDNVVGNLENGSIVLLHSTRYYDVAYTIRILQTLLELGYSVETVSESLPPLSVWEE